MNKSNMVNEDDILKRFRFLETKHGFTVVPWKTDDMDSLSSVVEYVSKRNPSMKILIGAWYPDKCMGFDIYRKSIWPSLRDEDGYSSRFLRHVFFPDMCDELYEVSLSDEKNLDQAIQNLVKLLEKIVEKSILNKKAFWRTLRETRDQDLEEWSFAHSQNVISRNADKAWVAEEYEEFLNQVQKLDGELSATNKKRQYLARKRVAH